MTEKYELIKSLIQPICQCYIAHYPDSETKVYPYVELNFPEAVINNEFSDLHLVQIDIRDNKDTTDEIESIAESIEGVLNKYEINNEKMYSYIFKHNPFKTMPEGTEPEIQTRRLQFQMKVYKK